MNLHKSYSRFSIIGVKLSNSLRLYFLDTEIRCFVELTAVWPMVSEFLHFEIEICIFQINRFVINSAKTRCDLDFQKFILRESEQF